MQREDLHMISRHSDLTEEVFDMVLKEKVYNNKETWGKFLRLFFMSLGVGFTVSGLVFFFAYNWDYMHKFAKIGLIEGLLIATTIFVFLPKLNSNIRNIILTGASLLVGVFFAVFGQIYQTGANAYDFFLGWTIFISLWVFISNFPPLWLLYLVLINTTFIMYSQQVAKDWSTVFICTLLFVINAALLLSTISFGKKLVPNWFINTVALAAASYSTVGIVIGVFDEQQAAFPMLLLMTALVYFLGFWQGLRTKNVVYLSIIPFSIIIIFSALLIKISDGGTMFLLVSIFIIASITLTIKNLIDFQKKWSNEK